MSITWADVQAIAPELTDTVVPIATQTVLLTIVDAQIDDVAWGDLADIGRRYLGAHLGSQYGGGSVGGNVTSETLGPMSRSYAVAEGVVSGLSSSKYGVEYARLLRLLPSSLGFVP